MPQIIAFHERDALARHGVRDDHLRLALHRLRLVECRDQRRHVVAVARDDVPVERAVFVRQRLERHDVLGAAVDLDEVAVDDARQVVELELGGRHHRFPVQPALVLAVRRHHVHAPVRVVELRAQRHARALREPFTQRTRRRLERFERYALRVALQPRPELAQRQQFVDRKISGVRHRTVTHRRDVAA